MADAPKPANAQPASTSPVSDDLHRYLVEQLGHNWRQQVGLTMRADHLYWMVNLIEAGIEYRRQQWKAAPGGIGASEAASLADFRMNLEEMVEKVKLSIAATQR
jgi:hypothetical protein